MFLNLGPTYNITGGQIECFLGDKVLIIDICCIYIFCIKMTKEAKFIIIFIYR